MYVVPDSNMAGVLTAILAQLGTTGTGLLHIHLFSNNFTPTKNSVLADFTEVTNVEVPGYVPAHANFFAGVPFRTPAGSWEGPDSLADPTFLATGAPPAPQVAYGFFVTDTTDAILLGSGVFANPFTFFHAGDGFTLEGNPQLNQGDANTLTLTFPDWEPV